MPKQGRRLSPRDVSGYGRAREVLRSTGLTRDHLNDGWLVSDGAIQWLHQRRNIRRRCLRQHGRNGIPLYVLYAGDLQTQPVILPQLLTRSIMIDALATVRR